MAERVRTFDWSRTPLGPIERWPRSLSTAVGICLHSQLPTFVWWGPELINIYNDGYATILGKRHPDSLGRPARDVWPELWQELRDDVDAVIRRGVAVLRERVRFIFERNGYPEETFFTYSHSPIPDDNGGIGGLFQVCFDETARVVAERDAGRQAEQRQQADDQIRTILESITDAFFAVDSNWRYTYVNAQAERLLDRTPGDLIGRSLWDAYPGLVGSVFEAGYRRVMTDRVAESTTAFYPDSNRWYEVHRYPAPDGGMSIYFRDVTDTQLSEQALQESNALLRGISDSTGDVIYAKDLDGRLRFANPATLALIGKSLDWAIGKTDAEFLDDKDAARVVMDNDRVIMDSGVAADIEERVPLPDGTVRIWSSRKMPNRGPDGVVVGLLGVSRDITEPKRSAERIGRLYAVAAALSEAVSPDDVARVTVEQGIVAAGATAGSLALLTDDGEHMQTVASMGFPPNSIQHWAQYPLASLLPIAEAARTGAPVYVESPEERMRRYPALSALMALVGTRSSACLPLSIAGKTVGAVGLSFDHPNRFSDADREFMVSLVRQCAQALERARLFEAERTARAEAERASKMKDEFLATLSHELRTPLNAILGWASILTTGKPDEDDLRDGLDTIQRNARAQTQIIEDLLDMSRIISGKIRLDVQRVDLAAVLRSATETVRPAAEARGVRLRPILDPQAGPVSGDPGRLQQVFWNLLSNAVKFTPRGGQVQVLLERVNSHLEVTVADTGEGILPEFLPHVFDRFRQADASSTRRHGGLGLGLAIVKQLVELHGGTVRAKSPGAGQGSTFIVAMPLTVVHADPTPTPAAQERRHPAAVGAATPEADPPPKLTGMRLLVVDDEPDARALLKRLLEDSHAVVRVAASAEEAIQAILEERPDVLISDIGMPGEDGYALIRRVRSLDPAQGRDIPAVALTAYARTEDRVRAIRAGFQSHVVKPVEPLELITVVASLADRRKR